MSLTKPSVIISISAFFFFFSFPNVFNWTKANPVTSCNKTTNGFWFSSSFFHILIFFYHTHISSICSWKISSMNSNITHRPNHKQTNILTGVNMWKISYYSIHLMNWSLYIFEMRKERKLRFMPSIFHFKREQNRTIIH